jgi:hypothetical protein
LTAADKRAVYRSHFTDAPPPVSALTKRLKMTFTRSDRLRRLR